MNAIWITNNAVGLIGIETKSSSSNNSLSQRQAAILKQKEDLWLMVRAIVAFSWAALILVCLSKSRLTGGWTGSCRGRYIYLQHQSIWLRNFISVLNLNLFEFEPCKVANSESDHQTYSARCHNASKRTASMPVSSIVSRTTDSSTPSLIATRFYNVGNMLLIIST